MTVPPIRKDFLGGEGRLHGKRALSGGEGWPEGEGQQRRDHLREGRTEPRPALGSWSHSILLSMQHRNISKHSIVTGAKIWLRVKPISHLSRFSSPVGAQRTLKLRCTAKIFQRGGKLKMRSVWQTY